MKCIILIFSALLITGSVFANGLGGQRLEKVVGDQIVDIGTDQTATPVAGEPIQFDFNLIKSDSREPITNSNVTVDIEHNGKTMVNSDIIMEPPLTLLVYTFPEGGSYTMKTTFYDKDRTLATASFPLSISGSTVSTRVLYIAALFISIFLGLLGGYRLARRRGVE